MNGQQEENMKFTWRVDPDLILDAVEFERFERVVNLLGIDAGFVVDSYTMSIAGPVLESLFVIGGGFIVEVRLSDKMSNFDFGSAKNVINYRIKYSEHTQACDVSEVAMSGGDQSPLSIVTKFVQISIAHTEAIHSQLTYFGEDLDAWVSFCVKAYPPSNVLN